MRAIKNPEPLDCVIIASIDILKKDKQADYSAFSSLKDGRWRLLTDNLKRYNYNLPKMAKLLHTARKVASGQTRLHQMLVGNRRHNWSWFDLIDHLGVDFNQGPDGRFDAHVRHITLNGVFLYSLLTRAGYSCERIQTLDHQPPGRLQEIFERKPKVAVVSATLIQPDKIYALKAIYEKVKELSPETIVIVGGKTLHSVFADCPELVPLVARFADYIVNEPYGHQTLLALMKAIMTRGSVDWVPNLIFKRGPSLVKTAVVSEKCSINEVAIDWRDIQGDPEDSVRGVVTSQGCPFQCRFCSHRWSKLEYKDLDTLRSELRSMHQMGHRRLFFTDDLFTLPESRLVENLKMMLSEGFDFEWSCLSRASGLSSATVALMAEAGCRQAFIGMESADPKVLENMDKRMDLDSAARQFEDFKKFGISTACSLVIGYPGETDQSIQRTVGFMNQAAPNGYTTYLFTLIRGTLVDSPAIRKMFKLEGEGTAWSHYTGTSLEMLDRLHYLVDNIRDDIMYMHQAFDIAVLHQAGFSIQDVRTLASLINKLYRLGRKQRPTLGDSMRSALILERIKTSLGEIQSTPREEMLETA